MTAKFSAFRCMLISLSIAFLTLAAPGCSKSNSLDGVYHSPNGGPVTLTIKDGKATMTIGTESKTLDYKVEDKKLTLINPQEGDAVFTINDDGTLNGQLGILQKSKE